MFDFLIWENKSSSLCCWFIPTFFHQFSFLKLITEKLGIVFIPILQLRDHNISISTIIQNTEHGEIDFACQS